MENILVALNVTKLNENTVDFACYIANLSHSKLTAIFIENTTARENLKLKKDYALPSEEFGSSPGNDEWTKIIDVKKKLFHQACSNRGTNCSVNDQQYLSVEDFIQETRFADLVIIDPETSYENKIESTPTHFTKSITANSECPVILVPYSFEAIEEIVFAYDGSKSSVFAIKQFMHILPELNSLPVTVVKVNTKEGEALDEADKITDLLKSHFSEIRYENLWGKPGDELFGYLLKKANVFIVMGAYGRGLLTNSFKHSTADLILKAINLPIFITHF